MNEDYFKFWSYNGDVNFAMLSPTQDDPGRVLKVQFNSGIALVKDKDLAVALRNHEEFNKSIFEISVSSYGYAYDLIDTVRSQQSKRFFLERDARLFGLDESKFPEDDELSDAIDFKKMFLICYLGREFGMSDELIHRCIPSDKSIDDFLKSRYDAKDKFTTFNQQELHINEKEVVTAEDF